VPRETFRRSSWIGFAAAAILILLLAAGAFAALNASIASNRAAFRAASDIARFGQFDAEVDRKMTALRNWVVTRDESALVSAETARGRLRTIIAELEGRSSGAACN
jgi:CHASE3 domain sensor protein